MYDLPTTIQLGEKSFPIRNKGDFRLVLDCFEVLNDMELTEQERVMASLIIFYDGIDDIFDLDKLGDIEQAVKEMYNFFNCNQMDIPNGRNPKLVDWVDDAQLIISAVNNVANKEVRNDYVHWWTFMGYYMAIGESLFSNVISIRSKIAKGKKLEKYEQEFRRDNPQYFTNKAQYAQSLEYNALADKIWGNLT